MAKVRVYELARELNLESKELVDKLVAGGMAIKNYMSTLDEDSVKQARAIISGVVSEVIEEKRIKSTVIRRRKKKIRIREKPEAAPVEEEAKEAAPEPPPVETEPPDMEAQAFEAAEPEEIEEEALPETAPEAEEPVAEAPEEIEPSLKEEAEAIAEVTEEEKPPQEAEKQAPPSAKTKEKAKSKKTKKKKLDTPARIVKPAEEGPLRELLAREREEKEKHRRREKKGVRQVEAQREIVPKVPGVTEGKAVSEKPQKDKPVKKKRQKKAVESEVKAKKAVRRRKREVYERADLYEGRVPKRKEKKGGRKTREASSKRQTEITTPKAIKRRIKVQESVTIAELAKAMGTKAVDLIRSLIKLGHMARINDSIDFETASVVADEFGYELELDTFEEERLIKETEDQPEDLLARPPVVTIMGHVDHGKTSLLDYIRHSNVTGEESGGITQHIGAYHVKSETGDIVFLDTPGHEAFTEMRARGAKVTDLIVLVVAADDGVMPQTKEAVNHARAAEIPIVVAVNKIDKPDANPEKVKRELAELDLSPEEWGGETIFGHISAKTGEGVDDLLGLILLQAEILELKGNPNKDARGTVIEARLDKSRGPVATVLIKNGTLKQGNFFVCGEHYGRVRAMLDYRGRKMDSASPSIPVEIYGISGVPMAGDEFVVVKDDKAAKQITEHRRDQSRKRDVMKRGLVSLDDLFSKIKEGEVKELNIVLKADVQGSLEALEESLTKQSTDEVKVRVIHSATGAVTESDVMLASASGAIIIGFNVRTTPRVTEIAEKENVDIRYYDVIYNVIKDIRLAMVGLLEPVFKEHVIGRADIKEIFHVPKVGTIAGSYITDGHIERNAHIRVLRDNVVVFDGKIGSLRRFKEDVKDVATGYECGIGVENFQDLKPGDVFEVYQVEQVEAEL